MHNELILINKMYPMLADQKFWTATGITVAVLGVIALVITFRKNKGDQS